LNSSASCRCGGSTSADYADEDDRYVVLRREEPLEQPLRSSGRTRDRRERGGDDADPQRNGDDRAAYQARYERGRVVLRRFL